MNSKYIPFSKPYISKSALNFLEAALSTGSLQGEGDFTRKCEEAISRIIESQVTLLVPSCTDALEMASLLIDIRPGDEIVLPSYTFTSAALAVVKLGGVPVFVDIDPETLNLSTKEALNAISSKTKAISYVNYAGFGLELDELRAEISGSNIFLIEDNAHGFGGKFNGKSLGTFGDISVQSFHATKNIHCGEGGSIAVNREFESDPYVLRQKGTNRKDFKRGLVNKYHWVDKGSSFLASELQAAFLLSQIEIMSEIQTKRYEIWNRYQNEIEDNEYVQKPATDSKYSHTSHIFYLRYPNSTIRDSFIEYMQGLDIQVTSHYEPLHKSPAGLRYGNVMGNCSESEKASNQIVRLPIWPGMSSNEIEAVICSVNKFRF